MPNQADPSELSRPAKVVKAIYLGAAVLGGALVTASVIVELWFPTRAAASGLDTVSDQPSDVELLRCTSDVRQLQIDLGDTAAELIRVPASGAREKPVATRWTQFSRSWQQRWETVGARCRFAELEGTRAGVHFDRVARVHRQLAAERLRYDGLVRRFDNEQAHQLASMRRALDTSQRALERRLR